jgi:hypothetical protein
MILIEQYHITLYLRTNQTNERKLVQAVRSRRFRTALDKAVRGVMRRERLTSVRHKITR